MEAEKKTWRTITLSKHGCQLIEKILALTSKKYDYKISKSAILDRALDILWDNEIKTNFKEKDKPIELDELDEVIKGL